MLEALKMCHTEVHENMDTAVRTYEKLQGEFECVIIRCPRKAPQKKLAAESRLKNATACQMAKSPRSRPGRKAKLLGKSFLPQLRAEIVTCTHNRHTVEV